MEDTLKATSMSDTGLFNLVQTVNKYNICLKFHVFIPLFDHCHSHFQRYSFYLASSNIFL